MFNFLHLIIAIVVTIILLFALAKILKIVKEQNLVFYLSGLVTILIAYSMGKYLHTGVIDFILENVFKMK